MLAQWSYTERKQMCLDRRLVKSSKVLQRSVDFLWVDHDFDNSQEKDDSRIKQSFLRKKYHRLRRQTQLEQLKASIKPPPVAWLPASKSTVDTSTENKHNDPHKPTARIIRVHQMSGQISHPPSTRVDDVLPVLSRRAKQSMGFYFDYFRAQASRRWYPMAQNEILNSTLRQCLDLPPLLEVIVSMSAYDYAMARKTQDISSGGVSDALHDAFYVRSHIIQSIQTRLSKPSEIYTESTVIVIGHLFVTEALECNLGAVDAHIEALQKIVHVLGGLERLDQWPLATIYACDPIRGLFKDSPPAFDIPRKLEIQVFKAIADRARPIRKSHPTLGSRFLNSPWSHAIHPRLGIMIESAQDILAIYEDTLRLRAVLSVADHNCALLLLNRLQSLPHAYTLSCFNDAIRLSIWIHFLTRVWEFQASAERLLETLYERLKDNESINFLETSAPDLLLWMTFNGAFTSMGFRCHACFVSRLRDLAKKMSLFHWGEVVSVLEDFFFVRRSSTDPAKLFWDEVIFEQIIDCEELG